MREPALDCPARCWDWLNGTGTGLLLGALFYLLSVGPMIRLRNDGYISYVAISSFYYPIAYLENNTPYGGVFLWYADLWLKL